MQRQRTCWPSLVLGALPWLLGSPGQAAPEAGIASQGLDLIVLVDVSSSMYTQSPSRLDAASSPPNGSDPERIRWDAVKLVADLLTPDDRMFLQRFNETTPPKTTTEQGLAAAFFDPDGKVPIRLEDEFPLQFVPMFGDARKELERRMGMFNTTTDRLGSTDLGGTRMIHALQVAAARLGATTPGRRTCAILLTDGLDRDHALYPTDRELREALGFYTGAASGSASIPIYTIGLGSLVEPTSSATPASANTAEETRRGEEFLLRISALTGGNYSRARTNRDLIAIFLNLIRGLKDIWFTNPPLNFAPSQPGELKEIPPTGVTGIVDLGVLAYEYDEKAAGAKSATRPPPSVREHWTGLGDQPPPQGDRRTGKDNTVYDCRYYGKRTREENSPFANLPESTRLAISLQGGNLPQMLVLSKRTQQPLFSVIRPEEGARFYRYQSLDLGVLMRESAFFGPQQFEVTARLVLAGSAARSASAQEAKLTPLEGTRQFAGRLSLRTLPQSGRPVDYYTLLVSVRGKPLEGNSLTGFQLDLAPRTIAVEDKLWLNPVPPIELTEAEPRTRIEVSTAYAVEEGITLQAQFAPFRLSGRPIDGKDLVFASASGPIAEKGIPLSQGKGWIAIGFKRDAPLPQGGLAYEPGKIVISGGRQVRMDPVEIEVGLRLALAKIGIEPPVLSMEAKPEPLTSGALAVRLTPPQQPRTAVGQLSVELRQAAVQTSAGSPADPFSPQELWLRREGRAPADAAGRTRTLSLQLDESFQVCVHPQGAKDPGKYEYEILVSGTGVAPARAGVTLSVNPPVLEVRPNEATFRASPGTVGAAEFQVRLRGLAGRSEEVYLRPRGSGSSYVFENTVPNDAPPRLELPLDCPTSQSPLPVSATGQAGESPWVSLPLRLRVPEKTPFGRYRAAAVVSGKQVAEREVSILLAVNDLVVELSVGGDGQGRQWQTLTQVKAVQFLGHDMTKTLRIRTGLGDPLTPEQVQVIPLRPFADEAGDTMPPPRLLPLVSDNEGRGLLAKLHFTKVPMAHVMLPYRLRVEIVAPSLGLRPASFSFLVRFWDPYKFLVPEKSQR